MNGPNYAKKIASFIINFYEVSSYFIDDVLRECGDNEEYIEMYNTHVFEELKRYIVRNYHVNSKNGYANLRDKPKANAEIITTIPNDEYVCFLYDAGDWEDWVKVSYTSEKIMGYIHKSELEER